ncbi:hypothetical protein, partial [Butyrivibrio sp. INlla14]|uniref:hypothetical protein n=1 Tax=Butyrivibrio sp. INlla14 TaxID=1520808 RepID=UPI001A9A6324
PPQLVLIGNKYAALLRKAAYSITYLIGRWNMDDGGDYAVCFHNYRTAPCLLTLRSLAKA